MSLLRLHQGVMGQGSGPPPSTFPVIDSITVTPGAGGADPAASTKTLVMPASINAGDLLLWVGAVSCQAGTPTITPPTGWTQLVNEGTTRKLYACYKVATGTEGASPQDLSFSITSRSAGNCYRIGAGTYTGNPEAISAAPGAGTATCPSLSPTWGSLDMLAIAACTGTAGGVTVSAYPLPDHQSFQSTGTNSAMIIARCSDEVSASPISPGGFTLSAYNNVRTATIAVRGT